MRTDTHRLAGTLVALGFVAGWVSASWVNPPIAITQTPATRTVAPPPDVPIPHVMLDAVSARGTTPAVSRNPFAFTDRSSRTPLAGARSRKEAFGLAAGGPEGGAVDPSTEAATAPAPPPWRLVGVAADAGGRITAVVSGGGDVFLLALGDRLPDGSSVMEVDGSGLVLASAAGERIALRLP